MHKLIDILLVTTKSGIAKKTQQPYSISEAQCVLRNEDGSAGAVGVLMIPKSLEETIKPGVTGLFTGTFALVAASYGEQQGRIVAQLTGLVPAPVGIRRVAAP